MVSAAMPKKTDHGNAFFHVLDGLLAVSRHLENENLPAQRMQMSCGHLNTLPDLTFLGRKSTLFLDSCQAN